LTVLGEAGEEKEIKVLTQIPGNDPQEIGTVDRKGLTRISNIVKSEDSNIIFKELINVCRLEGLENYIYPIFEKYDVNYDEIKRLLVDGKDSEAMQFPITSKIVGKTGSFELWSTLKPVIKAILNEQEENDAASLFTDLFNFEPPKGTVATGKGELSIILFSDGRKVKYEKDDVSKGDIVLSDGRRLELKIGQGRLASARSRGFEKARIAAEQLVHKRMNNTPITTDELSAVNLSLAKSEDVALALDYINKTNDPNILESLIWAPSLIGYGSKGFEYLLIMNNKDRAAGKYVLSYFDVRDRPTVFESLSNKQLSLYADNEGLTVTSGLRPTGKIAYKQYKPTSAKTKQISTSIPPERPPAATPEPAAPVPTNDDV
jgi:hypothetical protein